MSLYVINCHNKKSQVLHFSGIYPTHIIIRNVQRTQKQEVQERKINDYRNIQFVETYVCMCVYDLTVAINVLGAGITKLY